LPLFRQFEWKKKMRNSLLIPVLMVLAAAAPASGLYFLLGRAREKCFVEEMPANTRAVGSYKNPDWSPADDLYVGISVKDIDDAEVYAQKAQIGGRFAFSSVAAGVYQICMKVTLNETVHKSTGGWFGGGKKTEPTTVTNVKTEGNRKGLYKFHLSVMVGQRTRDYGELMKKTHLSEMEVEVLKLTDRVKDIGRELTYQNGREEEFRNTSESTNTRVMWWSILQMSIMLVSALFQSYHLKSFFEAKKLV
jgi:p24 family protein alpha